MIFVVGGKYMVWKSLCFWLVKILKMLKIIRCWRYVLKLNILLGVKGDKL